MLRVQEIAQQQMQRQRLPPQYASMFMPRMEAQAAQQLILQKILLAKADSLGLRANDDDVRNFIRTDLGQYFFPNGQWVGDEKYKQTVYQLTGGLSVGDFEKEVQDQITINRLRSLITAGVTVSDNEIRDQYKKQNIKIKFDYAVISQDDLRKQINPTDAELQAFFTKNAARYANAVPEERKITYFAFTADQIPGGVPKATEQEVQAYYNAHQADYSVPEQSKSRHILIKYPGGAAKSDAEAKAKAEDLLKQIKGGANLGFARRGTMVPEFDNAIFTQKIGDTTLVHTQFGYHIIQVEERQPAHSQSLAEVTPTIQVQLIRQKEAAAESAYAQALATEAVKNGLDKTAGAHHLQVVTTPELNSQGTIAGLPDGSQVVSKAFTVKQGATPAFAPTGEGYAIFQVVGVTPSHAPSFAEFKSKIASDYADERLPQLLNEKTKELADKAKAYNDLAKAAKEMGATVKTSDLVGESGQVPDFGQVGSVAPDLFNMAPGTISGPINAQRTGVVAKILDKVSPTPEEVAKNLDSTREQILNQRQEEVFGIYVSTAQDEFKKAKLIAINAKLANQQPTLPGE
jgi:peptidyl-prolyl cis-trans isomerase D